MHVFVVCRCIFGSGSGGANAYDDHSIYFRIANASERPKGSAIWPPERTTTRPHRTCSHHCWRHHIRIPILSFIGGMPECTHAYTHAQHSTHTHIHTALFACITKIYSYYGFYGWSHFACFVVSVYASVGMFVCCVCVLEWGRQIIRLKIISLRPWTTHGWHIRE